MKQLLVLIIFVTVALVSPAAQAILELKASAGLNYMNPGDLNSTLSNYPTITINQATAIGGDLMIEIPGFPFGFGVRYEKMATNKDDGKRDDAGGSLSRTSVLLDHRFINTILYFGVIGSYGVNHSMSAATDLNNTHLDGTAGSVTSWSGGLEFGIKLWVFMAGVEGGYSSIVGSDVKKPDGTYMMGPGKNLDFSGVYAKGLAGFNF